MNTEAALSYVTQHSQSIIQWVFLAIVLLVGTLIAQSLFGKRAEPGAAAALPGDLSEQLGKLLEQSARVGTVAGPAPVVDDAQLSTLRTELKAREDEIGKLREETAKLAAAGAADPLMGARMKELEAKLAEYEILEDDIADLSLYKEENTRLKSELESLRGGGGDVPSLPEVDAGPADLQPARTAEAARDAALAAAAFDEPAPAAPAPAPDAARPAAEGSDDLFAEFATALEESGVGPAESPKR